MATKVLPIILPPAVYAQLEEQAATFERDPLQQARWLLRQALGDPATQSAGIATSPAEPPAEAAK